MKRENVRNERMIRKDVIERACNGWMIEKDVTESYLQRRDDREGCNGRMIVMEGCQRRMSR